MGQLIGGLSFSHLLNSMGNTGGRVGEDVVSLFALIDSASESNLRETTDIVI